ncbi:MAG: hypothetical protein ICCCNLDF_00605 [Planctomycetes bacterium]|nr:hypothetical protein [Planctomycetota bacterium]
MKTFAVILLVCSLTSCVAKEPMSLSSAVDNLAVEESTDAYAAAWERIDAARSPTEMRTLIDHLQDQRPTVLLEALATTDGSPVNYTVGDALFRHLRCRFVDCTQGRASTWRQIDAAPHLQTKQALASWFARHEYDLQSLKADHEKVARAPSE